MMSLMRQLFVRNEISARREVWLTISYERELCKLTSVAVVSPQKVQGGYHFVPFIPVRPCRTDGKKIATTNRWQEKCKKMLGTQRVLWCLTCCRRSPFAHHKALLGGVAIAADSRSFRREATKEHRLYCSVVTWQNGE